MVASGKGCGKGFKGYKGLPPKVLAVKRAFQPEGKDVKEARRMQV